MDVQLVFGGVPHHSPSSMKVSNSFEYLAIGNLVGQDGCSSGKTVLISVNSINLSTLYWR